MSEKKTYIVWGSRTKGGKLERLGTIKASSESEAKSDAKKYFVDYIISVSLQDYQ